jgi:phage-related protein
VVKTAFFFLTNPRPGSCKLCHFGYNNVVKAGTPRRKVLWAPRTRKELTGYPRSVRYAIGRAIEVAQWGQTDTNVSRMKGKLREVFEITADAPGVTYRAMHYPLKNVDDPIAVLHVFKKKSIKGIATPKPALNIIEARLREVKESE